MDETTWNPFYILMRRFRKTVYAIKRPPLLLLELDFTLLDTYEHQAGEGVNFHYQSHGDHPLVCYDRMTGDLLKIELRNGAYYPSTGVVEFLTDHPDLLLLLRGDNSFTKPQLYEQCETKWYVYLMHFP